MSKYAFIDAHRAVVTIVHLCRVVVVSTSGFDDWHTRQTAGPTPAELAELAELAAEIRPIHARSRGAYGCPRVVGKLHKQGRQVNHKRVERLMAVHGDPWALRTAAGAHHDPRPTRRARPGSRREVLRSRPASRVRKFG